MSQKTRKKKPYIVVGECNLGVVGERIYLLPGYARNFLTHKGAVALPNSVAGRACEQALVEMNIRARDILRAAREKKHRLSTLEINLVAEIAASDGKLKDTITERGIYEILREQDIGIHPTQLKVTVISHVGSYFANVSFHPKVSLDIPIYVGYSYDHIEQIKQQTIGNKQKISEHSERKYFKVYKGKIEYMDDAALLEQLENLHPRLLKKRLAFEIGQGNRELACKLALSLIRSIYGGEVEEKSRNNLSSRKKLLFQRHLSRSLEYLGSDALIAFGYIFYRTTNRLKIEAKIYRGYDFSGDGTVSYFLGKRHDDFPESIDIQANILSEFNTGNITINCVPIGVTSIGKASPRLIEIGGGVCGYSTSRQFVVIEEPACVRAELLFYNTVIAAKTIVIE
ncbi:50S ribosomal L9 C-terminal domain-containing protein [Thalassospira tepidiphila]|uniref:50S ribosomal L9 C-terminal domain-containing protein n=1 Tax=Thalassospira tepidiphila TaxID=393657 RepID=UPI00291F4F82|nr:hypothetical protein MACH01_17840 [Thalassospira tepidiphila]